MSRLLDYLMEDETAIVFDIDGVLAIYEFGELCHSACHDSEWESYVRAHDPYTNARPVGPIRRFIEAKGPERVYACSVGADYEAQGKREFVLRHYGIRPENVCIVDKKDEKVAYLERVRAELDVQPARVALVEDTVKTLDLVFENTGFTTVHVTSFFEYEENA